MRQTYTPPIRLQAAICGPPGAGDKSRRIKAAIARSRLGSEREAPGSTCSDRVGRNRSCTTSSCCPAATSLIFWPRPRLAGGYQSVEHSVGYRPYASRQSCWRLSGHARALAKLVGADGPLRTRATSALGRPSKAMTHSPIGSLLTVGKTGFSEPKRELSDASRRIELIPRMVTVTKIVRSARWPTGTTRCTHFRRAVVSHSVV